MKFTFFLFLNISSSACIAQTASCGTSSSYVSIVNNISKLQFFEEKVCKSLRIKLNFIILKPSDGDYVNLGNDAFMGGDYITSVQINSNLRWLDIDYDETNSECSPILNNYPLNYPLESHNVHTYEVFTEKNTEAWDYYSQAKATPGYNQNSFTPNKIAFNQNLWPAMLQLANKYQQLYPDRLNVFFVENAERLTYYKNAIDSGTDIPLPWFDYTSDTTHTKIFSGASFTPIDYHGSAPKEFIIMANLQTEYLGRKHFGDIESPEWPASNEHKLDVWKWDNGGLLNHEVAHALSLGHRCKCDNLMENCDDGGNIFLDGDQLEAMQRGLAVTSSHKYVECDELSDNNCNIETTGNAIMDIPMSVYGDLIIKSGHTLTLKSEVYLSEESTIDVESGGRLIIDGAILTTGCEFETWKGIRVAGGNSDYDVKIINGALIENTREPAVSMAPQMGWPNGQYNGNGILIAENSTFRNCHQLANLYANTSSLNKSKIINCTQFGGEYGVINRNCDGVQVDNCRFYSITNHCIGAEDGSYDITNNDFFGGTSEVLFTNTKSGMISTIENNTFNTAPIGLRSMGTHTGKLKIEQNTFFSSDDGIVMEKLNDYDIRENFFTGSEFGVYCEQNGKDNNNNIDDNTFDGNERGIIAALDNDRLSFLGNCFNSSRIDVQIFGLVARQMGGSAPAGNCFTHKGSVNSSVIDMGGYLEIRDNLGFSFIYNEPDDNVDNCIDAVKADAAIFINDNIPGIGEDFCSKEDPDEPNTPCDDPERNVASLSQAISNLQSEIQSILESDLSDSQKQIEIYTPDRCRAQFKSQLYDFHLENENFIDAQELYTPAQSFDDHIAVFSAILLEGDSDKANHYLDNMSYTEEAELDYEIIQRINIDRLEEGLNFSLPSTQLNSLFSISEKDHSYAGFAKSLYYQITGYLAPIDINLPEPIDPIGERTNNAVGDRTKEFDVYPNPFRDILNLELNGYQGFDLRITNISGTTIVEQTINDGMMSFHTETWTAGIYILQIYDGKEMLERRKIALLR